MEVCSSTTWNWKWKLESVNVTTLGKLESRPRKRDVYETRVNYRLEGDEGSKFSQYANPHMFQNCLWEQPSITLELLPQISCGF